jgi:flagellar biosynthetic protein FliR
MSIGTLLPATTFAFFLVFARFGSALMLLPGFGEVYVPARARLVIALALGLVLLPLLAPALPPLPGSPFELLLLLGGEILVGLLIGTAARLMLLALQAAGMIAALQMSIANALVQDLASAQQGSIVGNYLMIIGVLAIFATDAHYLALNALSDSYVLFPAGALPPMEDAAALFVRTVAGSFELAVRIAAPFMIMGFVFQVGLGLLTRLMPQVQVFFLALPLQILLGFVIFLTATSAGVLWFLDSYGQAVGALIGSG